MKKSTHIHNEKDGVNAFLFYVLLPMAIVFTVIQKQPEPFNNQNVPIEKFEINNKTVVLYSKQLGNKKFEIKAPNGITRESKLFAAYKIHDNKLSDLKSVSYNGNVIWTNY